MLYLNDDRASLSAALRVCRTWFYCGVDVLWSSPPHNALGYVAPHRRFYYASNITRIYTYSIGDDPHVGLSFPRLRVLDVWLNENEAQNLGKVQLITATLVELKAPLTLLVLERLRLQQPRHLRKLSLAVPRRGVGDSVDCREAFFRWLMQRPFLALKSFELENIAFPSSLLFERFFSHWMQSNELTELLLGGPDAVQRATLDALCADETRQNTGDVAHEDRPLRHRCLRRLEAWVDASAVPKLVCMLPSVAHLALTSGEPSLVFPAIATLGQRLLSLKLVMTAEVDVFRRDLLALQSLTQLRELYISAREVIGAGDHVFVRVLAPMRHLNDLSLVFEEPPPSIELLGVVGEVCQNLRHLYLWGTHYLNEAVEASLVCPLFPMLEYFSVGRLDTLDLSDAR